MSDHYQTPGRVYHDGSGNVRSELITNGVPTYIARMATTEDAERLAICRNACDGISSADLYAGVLANKCAGESKLTQKCAELLAGLTAVTNQLERALSALGWDVDALQRAREMIAKSSTGASDGTVWVDAFCTMQSCRGHKDGEHGFSVRVPKGEEDRAICNECFSR